MFLAIDSNEDLVQEISDSVTHAVQMDATDENALRTLGLRNFDVAVVTIELTYKQVLWQHYL